MSCYETPADMFADGDWMDAVVCWLTAGGDPALMVVVPMAIYGTVLGAMFIVGGSPLIPTVISIILAGVIFTAFPANAVTIVAVTIMLMLSVGGTMLTWRMGR